MTFSENPADFMPDFSVAARIGPVVFSAILDDAQADTFGIVSLTNTNLLASLEDLSIAGAVVGSTVVVNGKSYAITALQQDGTGLTRVLLK